MTTRTNEGESYWRTEELKEHISHARPTAQLIPQPTAKEATVAKEFDARKEIDRLSERHTSMGRRLEAFAQRVCNIEQVLYGNSHLLHKEGETEIDRAMKMEIEKPTDSAFAWARDEIEKPDAKLAQHQAQSNVATEFYGEDLALQDGIHKNTPEEAARTGFGSYVVKDGKIISVRPAIIPMKTKSFSDYRLEREIAELKQAAGHKEWAEEIFNRSRKALKCPDDDTLIGYIENEVAPFIQSIVDLMKEHGFEGSTKDMPAKLAEWLGLFVNNTNDLRDANTQVGSLQQEIEALTQKLHTQKPLVFYVAKGHIIQLEVLSRTTDQIQVENPDRHIV